MLEIDPEMVVFVVFDAISVEYPRFFVKGSNTTTKERDMHYIFRRERFSVLLQKHFRMTPNSSKKFNILVFIQPLSTFRIVLESE